jgi:ribosomal protein S18 acetylase RimI-like enzyme
MFDRNGEDPGHPRLVLAEGRCDAWLAVADGQCGGFVLCTRMPVTIEGRLAGRDGEVAAVRGGVENLLVDAPYRRRGLGRSLMQAAERHYRANGLDGMQLATAKDNLAAQALYMSLGYRVIGEYARIRNGIQQARIRMAKDFT